MTTQTTDTCTELLEIIPAYAIGAVDDEEQAFVEANLSDCPEALQELAAYQQLTDALPYTVPAQQPAPEVWNRLQAATSPAASDDHPASTRWYKYAAAVLALLLVATNAFWAINAGSDTTPQAIILNYAGTGRTRQISITENGDTPTATLTWTAGAAAETWIGLFSARRFPALPDGSYQLWLFNSDGQLTSAGTFEVTEDGEGFLIFETGIPIGSFTQFGVTAEPIGGSDSPSGDPILASQF